MSRKLPVHTPPPTVEAARKRLGGRGSSEPGVGALVVVTTRYGVDKDGVVVFVRGDEVDVWIADDTVLRTTPTRVRPMTAAAPRHLAAVAADSRAFAALVEGRRVRFSDGNGATGEGMLAEKCRFGAIVARDDGSLVGVGFRRLGAEPSTLN